MEVVVSGEKLDENFWCNLHSKSMCLCHSHKMQQNCCISIHEMLIICTRGGVKVMIPYFFSESKYNYSYNEIDIYDGHILYTF
jgi:hypothetical protein